MRETGKRSFGSSGISRTNPDKYGQSHSRNHRMSQTPERKREVVSRRRSRSRSRSPLGRNQRRISTERLSQRPLEPRYKSNRDHNYRGRDSGPVGVAKQQSSGSRSRPREYDRNNRNREDGRNRDSFKGKDREFDRVVKRAREEKSPGYWNKKVIEAEEKNPNRWGHSGFKELYREDLGSRNRNDVRKKSRSPRKVDPGRRSRSISPRRHRDGSRGKEDPRRSPAISSKLGSKVVVNRSTEGIRRPAASKNTPNNNGASTSLKNSSSNVRPKLDSHSKEKLDKQRSESADSRRSRSPLVKDRKVGGVKSTTIPKPRSQSSSSSDEDILELHPRRRKASGSFSPSINSSSSEDEESSSDFSAAKAPAQNKSDSSSDSSESSEEEDNEASVIKNKSSVSRPIASDSSATSSPEKKNLAETSSAKKSKAAPGKSKARNTQTKKAKGSGESESESGSSSESEDEPRMTLSERFAKLTQMSTDKREFAKPELSIADIDTKLKVVKDLRNADTKIFLNGTTRSAPNEPARLRPKSPEYFDGEVKYNEDDRRKHFERMTRDEPENRPNDWNDVRVRYHYYRDRGYFDERPLSLEEYVKWEKWYYAYRDWLANESLYNEEHRNVVERPVYRGRNSDHQDNRNWRDYTRPAPGELQRTIQTRLYGLSQSGPKPTPSSSLLGQRPDAPFANRLVDHGRRPIQIQPDRRQMNHPRQDPNLNLPRNVNRYGQMVPGPQFRPGFRGTGRLAGRIGVRR